MMRIPAQDSVLQDSIVHNSFAMEPGTVTSMAAEIALRQLRHNTRNTLQRIVCLIAESPTLQRTPQGVVFAQDLVRRICLSADIADSLFGCTQPFDGIRTRLQVLANGLVRAFAESAQTIEVRVVIDGLCPDDLADTIVQIAHEVVGNAIKHGLRGRKEGRIDIKVATSGRAGTVLTISDDGRGFVGRIKPGQGLTLVQELASVREGKVEIRAAAGAEIVVNFPRRGAQPRAATTRSTTPDQW